MLHTKLIREEPNKSKALSLSHPLSGLGARNRGDWLSEGRDRDGTEGPGAAATAAEPIWERGECVLGGRCRSSKPLQVMGPAPGCEEEGSENRPGRLNRGWGIVQNKESRSQGESTRFSLKGLLRSVPSLLRVKDSRSGARGRVKAETDLPTHSGGLRTVTVACVAVCEDKTYSSEQQYSA